MLEVTLYALRNGEDVDTGRLVLKDGVIVAYPCPGEDNKQLLTNIVKDAIVVWVKGEEDARPVFATVEPELFMQYLHQEYCGTLLRASKAVDR